MCSGAQVYISTSDVNLYLTGTHQWNSLSAVATLLSRYSAQQKVMLEEQGFAEVWGDRYRGKQ